jgi:hypothetical protein
LPNDVATAQGAVLLPEYVDGAKKNETMSEDNKSIQKHFAELLQQCHCLVSTTSCNVEQKGGGSESSNHATKDLSLPITYTTDARFYSSIHQIQKKLLSGAIDQRQQISTVSDTGTTGFMLFPLVKHR